MRCLKDNELFLKVVCWSDWNNRKYYDRAGVYRKDENGFIIKQFPLMCYMSRRRFKRGEMHILISAPADIGFVKKEKFFPIIEQIGDEIGVSMIDFESHEFKWFNQFMKSKELVHDIHFIVCFTKKGSTWMEAMGIGFETF